MNVGLVGVGPWGMTLARKFTECGHEVLFYDRMQSGNEVEGVGQRLPWTEMRNWVDAMIVAATPPITADIALVCAMNGFSVLATKPLLNCDEIVIKRKPGVFAVDYVHLHSPIMKRLHEIADLKKNKNVSIEAVTSEFWGRGPMRVLNSIFDYGPHAISAVLELTTSRTIEIRSSVMKPVGDRELWEVGGRADDVEVEIRTGNGAEDERCRLDVKFSDGTHARYDEQYPRAYLEVDGKKIAETASHDPLRALIEAFADHVRVKGSSMSEAASQSDLAMSVDVMEAISKIRKVVADSP